jgi:anti-sigma B factor antagonist
MSLAELSVTTVDTIPARLEVAGELDVSTAPVLLARVRDVAVSSAQVVVDLGSVTFMDSRGMLSLLEAQQIVRSHGGDLTLTSVPSAVRKVLDITQAWELFSDIEGRTDQ